MIGVRVREGGFEGKCNYCAEYLPLSPEFWPMGNAGLRRCKACIREYKTLRERGYKASRKEVYNANQRARRALLPLARRLELNAYNRRWKAEHREYVAAYNRAYKARRRAA